MAYESDKNYLSDNGHSILPLSRIKTIMKSSPDVNSVGNDSLFMIAKATVSYIPHYFLFLVHANIRLEFKHQSRDQTNFELKKENI